jgi:hypothetical protein
MALTHARNATGQTMNFLHWAHAIELAAIELGVSAEWLREPKQRERLNRYYVAGEPAWMALDSIDQFWRGVQRASREDADGFGHIRAAAKAARR